MQVQGDFLDQVILNPTDASLIGQNATSTATVKVVANLQVGGANAAVDWDLSIADNDMSGETSSSVVEVGSLYWLYVVYDSLGSVLSSTDPLNRTTANL